MKIRYMSNARKIILSVSIILASLLIYTTHVNAASTSYTGPKSLKQESRIRNIITGSDDIQHVYCGNKLIYVYTHNVTYHNVLNNVDSTQYLEVENGMDAIPNSAAFDSSITLYSTPTNSNGYEFMGWTDNPNSYSVINTKTISGSTNLYAVYRKLVTVRCSRDNSVIGTGYNYYTNGVKLANAQIKLSAVTGSGWNNVGYRSDTDNKLWTSQYNVGETYSFSADTTLNVLWYQDITKTATFNSNGGTGVGNISKTIRIVYNSGNSAFGYYDHAGTWIDSTAVSINIHGDPGRSNYTFQGWQHQNGAVYGAGAGYTFAANNASETITFTALWKQNYEPNPALWVKNPGYIMDMNGENRSTSDAWMTWGGNRYVSSANIYVNHWSHGGAYGYDSSNNYHDDNRSTCTLRLYGITNPNDPNSLVYIGTYSVGVKDDMRRITGGNTMYADYWGAIPVNGTYAGLRVIVDGPYSWSTSPNNGGSWNTWLVSRIMPNF